MKAMMKSVVSLTLSALALLAPTFAHAGDNYVVAGTTGIVSNGGFGLNPTLMTFSLPANVYKSSDKFRRAVLQFQAQGVTTTHAEVYINSGSTVCPSDGAGDALQAKSAGIVDKHLDELQYTNHLTFTSEHLLVGSNTLMFCARNADGSLNSPLDGYIVHDVVLHYQTN